MIYEGATLCGHETQAVGEANRWPHRRITWVVDADLPGIARDSFRGAVRTAFDRWAKVCGITPVEATGSNANIIVRTQQQGPGGVLADCQLPFPGITERDSLLMRVDIADAWAIADNPPPQKIGLVHVLTHELGHGLGLSHGPTGCLMAPVYSAAVGSPQDWDIVQARLRYDHPAAGSPATPSGPESLGRFDGGLLRALAKALPAIGTALSGAGIDLSNLPNLPTGGAVSGDGLELLRVSLTLQGLTVAVLGRAIPLGVGKLEAQE